MSDDKRWLVRHLSNIWVSLENQLRRNQFRSRLHKRSTSALQRSNESKGSSDIRRTPGRVHCVQSQWGAEEVPSYLSTTHSLRYTSYRIVFPMTHMAGRARDNSRRASTTP